MVVAIGIEKDFYHDRWEGEILHYIGMGKKGIKDIK